MKANRPLFLLIIISTLVRLLFAAVVELGNDEVYYVTYALYPDLSHFDHPPMLGYLMQLVTFDLFFDSEVALRMGAILSGSISIYLIYLLGVEIKSKASGWYAALLYTASLYGTIISGMFIIPDNPLMPFWLLSMLYFIRIFKSGAIDSQSKRWMKWAGLFVGLAMLSKYHAAFLWVGAGLSILFYHRQWLKSLSLYLSIFITLVCCIPIVWWNIDNEFISFTFHSDRVSMFDRGIRFDYFFSELFGQVLYNNPVNVVLAVLTLIAIFKGKKVVDAPLQKILLQFAWPLISIVLLFALFRRTLPHWTAPAFVPLILLSAAHLEEFSAKSRKRWLSTALSLIALILMLGMLEINFGWITNATSQPAKQIEKQGKYDLTLDMYGWTQFSEKFQLIVEEDAKKQIDRNTPILATKEFNAAHLDYYVARPLDKKLFAFGTIKAIHKFAWINQERGMLQKGENAYYITNSRLYRSVEELSPYFANTTARDTVPIMRSGKVAEYFFVYYLEDYNGEYPLTKVKL